MNGKILVACIGNIFLGDDAFGVEMAKRLSACALPHHVSVVDFGIRSYDLAYSLMQEWDLIILVDALPRGGRPGTLYILEPDVTDDERTSTTLDAHTMNPVSVLQMVRALGGTVRRLLVVGCEPECVEPNEDGNTGLSAPVSGALEEAVRMIEGLTTGAGSREIAA
jgi:hydrogenase maturation protease